MGLGEISLGEMGLGEMGQNPWGMGSLLATRSVTVPVVCALCSAVPAAAPVRNKEIYDDDIVQRLMMSVKY